MDESEASMPTSLRTTACDAADCGERIEDRAEAYEITRPGHLSSLGASSYCSLNCAKRALMREERYGNS
jgi:hypothetical protein